MGARIGQTAKVFTPPTPSASFTTLLLYKFNELDCADLATLVLLQLTLSLAVRLGCE